MPLERESPLMGELDQLEIDLLAAADTWFSKGLHMKLQRLIAVARRGEKAIEKLRRLDELRERKPPSDPVDQPVAPKLSPSGGAAAVVSPARFAEPADMHGNGE